MAKKRPKPGPGHFQWNGGGWAGAQLGGSLWMLAVAVSLVQSAPGVALVWVLGFSAVNMIGLALWNRRDRIRPYPALQLLLLVLGISGLVGFGSLELMAPAVFDGEGWSRQDWMALLVVPVIMTFFALLEWRARGVFLTLHEN